MEKNLSLSDIILQRANDFVDEYNAVDLSDSCIFDFISDRSTNIDDCESIDEFRELFYEWNCEQEIIYYKNAWDFLKDYVERLMDYDFSNIKFALRNLGYESIDGLSSTVIATVVLQDDNNETFSLFLNELEKDDPFEEEEDYDVDDDDE